MCFFYQMSAEAQQLENRFNKSFSRDNKFHSKPVVNAFEYPEMPVVTLDSINFEFFNWGLIPYWAKDESIKKYTLNARIETLDKKPAFQDIVKQRCLIPATGYFEWQWLDAKGKQKEKYLIRDIDNSIFSFAGLFSIWSDRSTGEIRNTFTIITTEANQLLSKIHNSKRRMPVLLKKEDELKWLGGVDFRSFSFPYEVNVGSQVV